MATEQPIPVVGVYHASPERCLSGFRELLPDDHLRLCRRWDGINEIVNEVDVLLAFKFGSQPFPREAVLNAPRLKWIQVAGAGADHLMPFDPKQLVVTNAAGVSGDVIALYVLGALVNLVWNLPRSICQQRDRHWERYPVSSLAGKTMGILGAGHVGRAIGRLAHEIGMRVVGTRRSGAPVENFERVFPPDGLLEVIGQSDVLVLSLPLTCETRHRIGPRELEALRPTSYLVNVSRGEIVDEAALLNVLKHGVVAGAVLDVFAEEPLSPESEFWALPNVLVTPHMASAPVDWPKEVARIFRGNLERWLHGAPLANVVDPLRGY